MIKPKILIFATGSKGESGGSGMQELIEFSRTNPPVLDAEIVGVVSNIKDGGVEKKANKLGVPFYYDAGPFTPETYQKLVNNFKADYVMCSGWLKLVRGLPAAKVINIHPAPLPEFGGPGMYGYFAHEAVMRAYHEGRIKQSAVTMHYVIDNGESKDAYDKGPIIFKLPVLIREDDTAETLAVRVNEKERAWQAYILNLVVNGLIRLESGKVVYENGLDKIIPH
jgi:phosphoribosylglycinamide formyltransferase 1